MRRPEGHPILAAVLDVAMMPLARVRPGLVRAASGRVLELGVGTGLNLGLYDHVAELHAVEPDPHMLKRAKARAERLGVPATFHPVGAEALPFPDASFDTVVATFVFCTIPDVEAAAREALRVLRPGGTLLFAEHTLSEKPGIAAIQQGIEPAWERLAGGCHLTRDPMSLLRDAGAVDIVAEPRGTRWTLTPVTVGVARKG